MWSSNSVIHSVCKHWPTFSKIFSVWDYYLHSTIDIYINQNYANVQKYSAGLHLSKVASTIPGVKKLKKGKMVKCFLGFPTFLTSPDSSSIAKTPTSVTTNMVPKPWVEPASSTLDQKGTRVRRSMSLNWTHLAEDTLPTWWFGEATL